MDKETLVGNRCGCGHDLGVTRPTECPVCHWDFGASGAHPQWDAGWRFVLSVYSRWTGKHITDHDMLMPSLRELDAAFGTNGDTPGVPRACYSVTRRQRSLIEKYASKQCRLLLHHYEVELRSIPPSTAPPQVS
jgi:hypothetical protein